MVTKQNHLRPHVVKFPRALPAGRGSHTSKGLGGPEDICHHWHETYLLCKGFKNMSYRPWFFTNLHTQSYWLFNAPSTWSTKRFQIMKSLLASIFHLAFQKVSSLHAFECIFLSSSATRPKGRKSANGLQTRRGIVWPRPRRSNKWLTYSVNDGKGYWSNWGATDSLCFPFSPLRGVM